MMLATTERFHTFHCPLSFQKDINVRKLSKFVCVSPTHNLRCVKLKTGPLHKATDLSDYAMQICSVEV